jgi:hypothetical protein
VQQQFARKAAIVSDSARHAFVFERASYKKARISPGFFFVFGDKTSCRYLMH